MEFPNNQPLVRGFKRQSYTKIVEALNNADHCILISI
jgi:hypothetical protein